MHEELKAVFVAVSAAETVLISGEPLAFSEGSWYSKLCTKSCLFMTYMVKVCGIEAAKRDLVLYFIQDYFIFKESPMSSTTSFLHTGNQSVHHGVNSGLNF